MDLEDVVQHRHQFPLTVDLVFATQGEAPEPQSLADVAEESSTGSPFQVAKSSHRGPLSAAIHLFANLKA